MAQITADLIRVKAPGRAPKIAVVLGSGLGGLADDVEDAIRIPYAELPGFPKAAVSSHRGELLIGRIAGTEVAVLAGRAHFYEHGDARAMAGAIETLALLGVETLVLSNASGGVNPDYGPGTLMLLTDHISFSGVNPLIGVPGDRRFVDLVTAYDRGLADTARAVAADQGTTLGEGVYMWFSGPAFETPAEIRMARVLGADAVGMSTVPEVILARYFGLKVLAISMVTNFAAGMTGKPLSHHETKEVAEQGAARFRALVAGILGRLG
jgi:purine-nucleoside phosphorylase